MTTDIDPWRVLTAAQAAVARAFLAERDRERRHLVIYLSGAHAYGFPSPDSDLDLKCVHVAATHDLVGLDVPDETRDRMEVVDGVELDYGSNELAQALRGSIKGNGNFLERLFGWSPRSRRSTRPGRRRCCRPIRRPRRSPASIAGCATCASGSGSRGYARSPRIAESARPRAAAGSAAAPRERQATMPSGRTRTAPASPTP